MAEAIANFGRDLKRDKGLGLFYYAGHGMQVKGHNYLIPVGAKIKAEYQVQFASLDVGLLLGALQEADNRLNIVILDACRDNPFARSFRSSAQGLAQVSDSPSGTLIAYATAPGRTALDGAGRNSPYTKALLKYIQEPGSTITRVFQKVRKAVLEASGELQRPWETTSLTDEVTLVAGISVFYTTDVPATSPQSGGPAYGDTFIDSVTGIEFVWVPDGSFEMGSSSGETGRYSDEGPVHKVELDGFWIGKYEVTQGQWRKFMGNNPSRFKKGDNYPVEQVSWDDCQSFVRKLKAQSGKDFRLPTEAEWEYAARSGGRDERYSGGNDIDRVAWYSSNSGGSTHAVGGKAVNGLGLYDMSGNVWEWCSDWYDKNYYNKSPEQNPQGPGSGSDRVSRGGSWSNDPRRVRTAFRSRRGPSCRSSFLGFRLVSPGRR